MTRYHPLLVALHWVMAIFILLALFAGRTILAPIENSDPQKVQNLGAHMTLGLIIGGLLVIRLIVRRTTEAPPHAETGNALLDKLGVAAHWILYLLVAGMVLSGLGSALANGLFPIAFGGSGELIPEALSSSPPRLAHGVISRLLMAFVLLHIAAALYHQFFLKDGLFRRMWFGRRMRDD